MKWSTGWKNIESIKSKKESPFNNKLGIYQIRIVKKGKPICINRFFMPDKLGIIYIGRSGLNKNRTIRNRIREFDNGKSHSGGFTWSKCKVAKGKYSKYLLQIRAKFLENNEIKSTEAKCIKGYFDKYGELPPCNSSTPKKYLRN